MSRGRSWVVTLVAGCAAIFSSFAPPAFAHRCARPPAAAAVQRSLPASTPLTAAVFTTQERTSLWEALEAAVRARIERERPGAVAVSLVDLGSGARLDINGEVPMHAASTMKVAVLLELFRQAEGGRFSLDDSVVVRNEFTSIADGSRYSLSPADDGEQALYGLVGARTSLRDLARRMIVRSSNLATNLLMELVTADSVRRTMERLGAPEMRVLRGVEDIPAYRRGLNNTTTSRAFARVLEALARCEITSAASCAEMIEILASQEFNEQIPAGLPPGVRVAHKTGQIAEIHHDGGIVYAPGRAPYVLVVMTRGIADTLASARVGADVSRIVWRALVFGEAGAEPFPGDSVVARLLALHERYRVDALAQREFTHQALWGALGPIVDGATNLGREEVGRSVEGRPLHLVRFGSGPTRVLLWSQMHGDESTATMALADIFRFLADAPDDDLVRRLGQRITLFAIPMLNPDGAERFQRRNAQGIDINRDARVLATPEGRALKAVRDRLEPHFAFNLHDQSVRTLAGQTGAVVAMALLAPPFDASRSDNEVRARAKHVAAYLRRALDPYLGAHLARYDDTFNPRAFGDLMQRWGTSTVLIESGGWRDDPEKQFLRRMDFAAILAALDAIGSEAYRVAPHAWYESLPENAGRASDLLVLGGTIVARGQPPYRADLAIDYDDPHLRQRGRIVDMGDLADYTARDTIDATGLYLHLDARALGAEAQGRRIPVVGTRASLVARRGPQPGSPTVWTMEEGIVAATSSRNSRRR